MKLALALALLLPAFAAAPDTIHGNAVGDPKAPVLIEVFSDFQCPGCKRFHDETLPLVIKEYVASNRAYLVYRYFPLPIHTYGRKAAELVCACAQLGKYESAADALFAAQNSWSVNGKLDDALAPVLTPAERKKIPALVASPDVQKAIDGDLAEGASLGVNGTPTVLVTYKSKRYPLVGQGLLNYRWIKGVLDDLLK